MRGVQPLGVIPILLSSERGVDGVAQFLDDQINGFPVDIVRWCQKNVIA